jgi:hypothetical protein
VNENSYKTETFFFFAPIIKLLIFGGRPIFPFQEEESKARSQAVSINDQVYPANFLRPVTDPGSQVVDI